MTGDAPEVPMVSICCATYNHERYLARTLDSFLAQQVGFPLEIVIGEDCSTDRTPQIVQDYARRFPQIIRTITSASNIGAIPNALRIWAAARGKYIALCEGDDYWTDTGKLQKQVDFLEQHPEFTVTGHRVSNIDGEGNRLETRVCTGDNCPEVFGVEHALCGTPLHMNSWVFRTDALRAIPSAKTDLIRRLPAHDDPVLLLLLAQGKGRCFRDVMGVYRIAPGSYWATRSALEIRFGMLQYYYLLQEFLGRELAAQHSEAISRQIQLGEQGVALAVIRRPGPHALSRLLHLLHGNDLIPRGRSRALVYQVARQAAKQALRRPRALGGRVLRGLGLRRPDGAPRAQSV